MRPLIHHLAIAAVVAFSAAPAHAADFLKAIEDVPLPKGMTEQGEPVVFESEQGRVVRTSAEGQVGAAEISSFYAQSLPALGWTRAADGSSYERENERLSITIREPASARPVRITFELVVKVASTKLAE